MSWFVLRREIRGLKSLYILITLIITAVLTVSYAMLVIAFEGSPQMLQVVANQYPDGINLDFSDFHYENRELLIENGVENFYVNYLKESNITDCAIFDKYPETVLQIVDYPYGMDTENGELDILEGRQWTVQDNTKTSGAYPVWIASSFAYENQIDIGEMLKIDIRNVPDVIMLRVEGIVAPVGVDCYLPFSLGTLIVESNGFSPLCRGKGILNDVTSYDALLSICSDNDIGVSGIGIASEIIRTISSTRIIFLSLAILLFLCAIFIVCQLFDISLRIRARFIAILKAIGYGEYRANHTHVVILEFLLLISFLATVVFSSPIVSLAEEYMKIIFKSDIQLSGSILNIIGLYAVVNVVFLMRTWLVCKKSSKVSILRMLER